MYTWPVDRTCLPDIAELSDAEELKLQEAIDTAVMVLWAFTGRQYAIEDLEVRPCPHDDRAHWDGNGTPWSPALIAGQWFNLPGCWSECTPHGDGVVQLPGPVTAVTAVTVDGVLIDSSGWRREGDYLYRTNGGAWPGQDYSRPLGSPGTWSVSYQRGVRPPAGAASMVGQLAKEFYAVCTGGKCRLPRRWQSVTRQGVTIQRADPTDLLANNQTGIPEIDTWVHALNPNKLAQPARVVSPDGGMV